MKYHLFAWDDYASGGVEQDYVCSFETWQGVTKYLADHVKEDYPGLQHIDTGKRGLSYDTWVVMKHTKKGLKRVYPNEQGESE